jgi:ABC-type maltose transport system permease subunit
LAYEESKSFVTYLAARFGREIIFKVLNHMVTGLSAEAAIQKASLIPFETLEKEWQHSLRKKTTWFALLSYYLYEIIFTLMAFITVYAFIRRRIKKKDHWDDEPENT